jgi:hypothetical protein
MPFTLNVETVDWLTSYEERVIEAIMEEGDVQSAASELNVKPSTVYAVLSKVRVKLLKSQNTVNHCNVLKRKSRALRRLLVPMQKIAVANTGEETEEEDDMNEE